MEKLRIFLANGLAGSLDLCIGTLIAAATLSEFGIQPEFWHLALGAILAVLPDFDIIPSILLGREVEGNHHITLMHRPLVIIPAAALASYLLGGPVWGLVALLCVSWHYLHDTPPLSQGGIAWLWPFDHRYWSLRGPAEPHAGHLNHREWLAAYWLQPSRLSVTEVGAGLLSLLAALLIVLQ